MTSLLPCVYRQQNGVVVASPAWFVSSSSKLTACHTDFHSHVYKKKSAKVAYNLELLRIEVIGGVSHQIIVLSQKVIKSTYFKMFWPTILDRCISSGFHIMSTQTQGYSHISHKLVLKQQINCFVNKLFFLSIKELAYNWCYMQIKCIKNVFLLILILSPSQLVKEGHISLPLE